MAFSEGFISELVGRRAAVNDLAVGKVADFLVTKPDDTFPQIDGLVIKTSRGLRFAPIETVADVDRNGTVALTTTPDRTGTRDDEALYLIADLLDKQIVDVDGRKVVRINDIEVASTGGRMRVVAADIGVAGLLRRLGAEIVRPPVHARRLPSRAALDDRVGLRRADSRRQSRRRCSLSVKTQQARAPASVGTCRDHRRSFGARSGRASSVSSTTRPRPTRSNISTPKRRGRSSTTSARSAPPTSSRRWTPTTRPICSAELPEEQQAQLLAEMDAYTAGELRELVKYDEDTAGGLMTTDYVWIYPHRTTEATIRKIREIAPASEFIYYLYVIDKDDSCSACSRCARCCSRCRRHSSTGSWRPTS